MSQIVTDSDVASYIFKQTPKATTHLGLAIPWRNNTPTPYAGPN
jgi:hypothetical protein